MGADMPAFAGDAAGMGGGGGKGSKGGGGPSSSSFMDSGTGLLGQPTDQGGAGLDPSQMAPQTPTPDTSNAAAAGPASNNAQSDISGLGPAIAGGPAGPEGRVGPPSVSPAGPSADAATSDAAFGGPPPTTAQAATPGGSPQAIGAFPAPTGAMPGSQPTTPPNALPFAPGSAQAAANAGPTTLGQLSQMTQGLQPQGAQPTRQAYPESGYDPQVGFPDTGTAPQGQAPTADAAPAGDTTTTPPTAGAAPTGDVGGRTAETEIPPAPEAPQLTPPAGPTSTGPAQAAPGTTASGATAPGGAAGAQGASPFGILGDIIRAVLNPLGIGGGGGLGGLANQLAMESAGNPPGVAPWYPGYGPQSRIAPGQYGPGRAAPPGTAGTAPAGGQDPNKLPGAPGGPEPAANDPEGQRRKQWYAQNPNRGARPQDDPNFQPQGPTKEGGTLAGQTTGTPQQNASYIQGLGGHSTLGGRSSNDMSKLNPDFGNRLAAAGRAYQQETGQSPKYGEGYRDDATQRIYWNRLQGGRLGPVARPASLGGHGSLHQRGLAMDMPDSGFTKWLQQGNARRFGLGFPVPNDSNHIQMQDLRGNAYPYTPPPEIALTTRTATNQQPLSGQNDYAQRTIQIESGGRTSQRTGSNRGLAQFGPQEERRYGLNASNRDNPQAVGQALQREQAAHRSALSQALGGQEPTPADYYLAHQQGLAGATALISNPNAPAEQVLARYYGGTAGARRAIVGNGGRPGMTAGEFRQMWQQRFNQSGRRASAADFLQDQGYSMYG